MKLLRFRPRFSLRWLMIAVALAAVVYGLVARRASFLRQRDHWTRYIDARTMSMGPWGRTYLDSENVDKAMILVAKYDRAARYPWILIEPDPPMPDSDYFYYIPVIVGPDSQGEYKITSWFKKD